MEKHDILSAIKYTFKETERKHPDDVKSFREYAKGHDDAVKLLASLLGVEKEFQDWVKKYMGR